MAIKKKTAKLQNLSQVTTFIEESGLTSEFFNIADIPSQFPIGKSSILIMGSRFLREDVVIKMELLDSAGNAVYLEPVVDYSESGGVRVSIIVYDDVAPGTATLTILGELDPIEFGEPIPSAFTNKYNIKHTVPITINTEIANDRPIRFFKRPKVTVQEVVKGQLTTTNATSGSNTQSLGVVFGDPSPGSEGKGFLVDRAEFGEIATYTDRNFGFSPIGNYTQEDTTRSSYSFRIDGNTFKPEMVGGKITIASPNAKPGFVQKNTQTAQSYTSRITKVINANTIEVQKPFGLYDSATKKYVTCTLDSSAYSIVYPKTSAFTKSVVNFKSFADIQIKDVRTFSGDVNRIAAYTKNNGPYGNWTKIIDTPVEAPELLIDENSQTGTSRIGRFTGNSAVATYWNSTYGSFGSGNNTTLTTASDPEYLADSLFVSSSGINMLASNDDWIRVELKPQYSMSFEAGTEYVIRANLIVDHRNEADTVQDLKAVFHLSGSAFGMSTNYGDQGYGRAVGMKHVVSASSQVYGLNEPLFETTFTPDSAGTAVLQMRFTAGHWHISDLSIRPNSSTNFSPEFIRLTAPVPPLQRRPDRLDFAFEFYDVNNNKSNTVVTTLPDNPDGVEFNGENLNILGDDNSVGGSLFLGGDATGSGVQMGGVDSRLPETGNAGAEGSGFIRSVRYQGFTSASQAGDNTGFMIYSGSVLPDSGDNYAGVGLELVGESGSLRFGTNPSRFEVVADAFFVGSTNTQFISGSGGIIEISSSAFHLSSSGDVIISGSVTATSGDIGGWQIIDNKLSGSNATLDAAGAAIYMSNAGPATNPNDGYYIDFTPSNSNPFYVRFGPDFAVSSSGRLIASGALIEGVVTASGGLIANWVIGSDTISKGTGGTFTGLSSTGDTRFFAGATSLTNSGSAAFNVKSNGDISGSQVLFTGGKIGGFLLTNSILRNADNTVELSSTLPGLKIKDAGGTSRVEVKSGSLSTIGGGTQYIGNKSFEEQLGSLSAGRNFVGSINSWSFSEGGAVNISLTDRNAYNDDEKAVSGRVTLDVVVPAGSGNYSSNNTYEVSQIVTASIAQGDTLSFSSVARFSSSFGGKGKDRALGPQYFRVEYWNGSAFVPFLPANEFTASNGYGEYFLGSGQYASFGASAEIPASATHLKLVLTGSINDDSGFTIEKPLFVGDKGTVNSDISGRKFTKTVVGSSSPEYPETEITFDNFSLRSNTRKVEMTQEGLLIYNSEDSFLKMTGAGIEFRGGSGLAAFGQSINRESFTNDSQIAGTLAAPSLQAYTSDPEDIGTSASDGNVAEFAKGNHRHRLTSGTLDTVLASTNFSSSVQGRFVNVTAGTGLTGGGSSGTITLNVVGGAGITANANDIAVDSTVIRTTGAQSLGGVKTFSDEIQATGGLAVTGAVTASTNISASLTGSFGHILINGSPLQAATGTNTGDVSLAGSRNYITLGANQVITVNEIDIGDDTNLSTGNGITLSGDTISTNDSQIVHDNLSGFVANEHVDHSTVSISAGSGLTGGGTILANRTIHVGAGDGITVNSNDIAVNNTVIRTTGNQSIGGTKTFTAQTVFPTAGIAIGNHTLKDYGGDLTIESHGDDINLVGSWVRLRASDSGTVLSAFHGTGTLNLGGDGQTTYMLKVSSGNSYMAGNLVIDGTVDGRDVAADGTKLDGIATSADNFNKVKIGGDNNVSGNDVTSGQTFTIAGGTSLSTAIAGRTATISVDNNGIGATQLAVSGDGSNTQFLRSDGDGTFTWAVPIDTNTEYSAGTALTLSGTTFSVTNDSIGDTQLAFNTGQHLTTTSAPIFSGLTVNGTINVGNNGNGGSIQVQGTHDISLHSVKHISFDWDGNYDSYEYHGISSRDGSGNFSDDLTIASFDDIHIRVDSNNNDGPAFMNMYNNTHNSATIFGKWGYDGTNHILYHSGRVGIGTDNPQNPVHISGNTNSNLEITTGTAGLITLQSLNDARNAYEDLSLYGDNVNINANTSGKVLFTAPILSGSATSTGSFGRLDAHKIVADGSGTPLEIQGTSGSLFSVSDSFSGSLMSVADVSGIPILEVFDDDRVVMGSYSSPAMTVTGSFVGVGTSTPTRLIHLAAASPAIMWEDTDVSGLKHQIIAGGNVGLEYSADMNNTTTGYHRWDIGGSVAMKLIEGGSLRIGDGTNPSYKLDVNGDIRSTGAAYFNSYVRTDQIRPTGTNGIEISNSQGNIVAYIAPRGSGAAASGIRITDNFNMMFGSDNDYSIAYNSTRDTLEFVNGVDFAATRMAIDANGNVGIGDTTPDDKLVVYGGDKQIRMGADDSNHVVIGRNSSTGHFEMARTCTNAAEEVFFRATENEAGALTFFTSEVARFIIDANVRISLSNNDSGGTGGADSTSGNTLLGFLAGGSIASGGLNNTLLGHGAAYRLTTGDNNVSVGTNAGWGNHTGGGNTYLGRDAGLGVQDNANSNNVGLGFRALRGITTGTENVAIGKDAMYDNTGGSSNTAIGTEALANNTSGGENVAIGKIALFTNTTTGANTAVGYTALRYNTAGNNTAVGHASLHQNTSGTENVALGVSSAYSNTTGVYNTAVGYQALVSNVDGDSNTAIGRKALYTFEASSDGDGENTAVGSLAAYSLSTGTGNTSIGKNSMTNATTADNNVAVGLQAMGLGVVTGDNNVAVGNGAGYDLTSGISNVLIGKDSGVNLTTGQYNVMIGAVSGDSIIDSSGHVLIGTGAGGNGDIANDGVTAVGHVAAHAITSAQRITAVGYQALTAEDAGSYHTAVGYQALAQTNADNGHNTALGQRAGYTLTSGHSCTLIGSGADSSDAGGQNRIGLGQGVSVGANNIAVIGNNSITDVYMAQDAGATVRAGSVISSGIVRSDTNLRVGSGTGAGNASDPAITTVGDTNTGIYFPGSGKTGIGGTGGLEVENGGTFGGGVTLTGANAEIRMQESGDTNYFVALRSIHNAGDTFLLHGLKGEFLKHIRTNDSDENTHTLRLGGALPRVDIVSGNSVRMLIDQNGNATFYNDVTISGEITGTVKSFKIDHPTKEGKKLQYGSLEGPEHGVYVRGKSETNIIELPDYWTGLVDEDTITVQITPVGGWQKLYVKKIEDNKVYVGKFGFGSPKFFYNVYAERKDVDKLEVEYDG